MQLNPNNNHSQYITGQSQRADYASERFPKLTQNLRSFDLEKIELHPYGDTYNLTFKDKQSTFDFIESFQLRDVSGEPRSPRSGSHGLTLQLSEKDMHTLNKMKGLPERKTGEISDDVIAEEYSQPKLDQIANKLKYADVIGIIPSKDHLSFRLNFSNSQSLSNFTESLGIFSRDGSLRPSLNDSNGTTLAITLKELHSIAEAFPKTPQEYDDTASTSSIGSRPSNPKTEAESARHSDQDSPPVSPLKNNLSSAMDTPSTQPVSPRETTLENLLQIYLLPFGVTSVSENQTEKTTSYTLTFKDPASKNKMKSHYHLSTPLAPNKNTPSNTIVLSKNKAQIICDPSQDPLWVRHNQTELGTLPLAFIQAADSGTTAVIKPYFENKYPHGNIDPKDPALLRFIMSITKHGDAESLRYLTDNGVDIHQLVNTKHRENIPVDITNQLIQDGVKNSHVDIVEHLLKLKADLTVRDEAGNNLLHLAVQSGSSKLVQLITPHTDERMMNQKNTDGKTALSLAFEKPLSANPSSQTDVVKSLMLQGASSYEGFSNSSVLHEAIASNNLDLVNFLVDNRPYPEYSLANKSSLTPVELAVKLGNPEIIQRVKYGHSQKLARSKIDRLKAPLKRFHVKDISLHSDSKTCTLTFRDTASKEAFCRADTLNGLIYSPNLGSHQSIDITIEHLENFISRQP